MILMYLPSQVVPFLLDHLRLNLEQIAACLGKNEDEAVVLLHQIVNRMSTFTTGLARTRQDAHWGSKAARRVWEAEFGRSFVVPEVGRLDERVRRLAEAVADDQSAADVALATIMTERRADDAAAATELFVDNPRFWDAIQ